MLLEIFYFCRRYERFMRLAFFSINFFRLVTHEKRQDTVSRNNTRRVQNVQFFLLFSSFLTFSLRAPFIICQVRGILLHGDCARKIEYRFGSINVYARRTMRVHVLSHMSVVRQVQSQRTWSFFLNAL